MRVPELIERLRGQTVESEDGDELSVELYPPATDQDLAATEQRLGRKLGSSFREFLKTTNGMQLFDMEILSCRTGPPYECASFMGHSDYLSAGLVPIHGWGNGDFDALDFDAAGENGEAPVAFCNHNSETKVHVADTFERWLEMVAEEMMREGTLLHPSDFMSTSRAGGSGVYALVPQALENVDCELWATFGGDHQGGGGGTHGATQPPDSTHKKPWWRFW